MMDEVPTPLVMNMFYFCDPDGKTEYVWSKEKYPVDEWTPKLGRFLFRNITCTNAEIAAGAFYGLPEQPIEDIVLENVSVDFKDSPEKGVPALMSFAEKMSKEGMVAVNVKHIKLDDVVIQGKPFKEAMVRRNFEKQLIDE
jgi:polygalacturonase